MTDHPPPIDVLEIAAQIRRAAYARWQAALMMNASDDSCIQVEISRVELRHADLDIRAVGDLADALWCEHDRSSFAYTFWADAEFPDAPPSP